MKDGYGNYRVMSTHAVGRHYTIVTIPIFHAVLGQHFLLHQVFYNQENSAFAQLHFFLLAIFVVEMTERLQKLLHREFFYGSARMG